MKKVFALFLMLVMVFALCACGGNSAADSDPTVNDTVETPNEPSENVSVDEPVDEPVASTVGGRLKHILKTDSLNVHFSYSDDENSFTGTMNIVDNASPAILHISVYQDIDYVYEKDDNGVITKYESKDNGFNYEINTELSQEELQEEIALFMYYFTLTGWNFTSLYPGFSYEQFGEDESIDDYLPFAETLLLSLNEDDVWYKIYDGEEMVGFIAVDPETGIFNSVKTGSFTYNTMMSDLEANLPYYK